MWVASLADNGAIDGYSGLSPGIGALEGLAGMQANFTWGETFFGQIPGSLADVNFLNTLGWCVRLRQNCIWRIIFATLIGMFLMNAC